MALFSSPRAILQDVFGQAELRSGQLENLLPSFIVKTCSQRCRENTGTLFASYVDEHTHPNDSLVARRSAQEAVVLEPVLPLCSPLSVSFL